MSSTVLVCACRAHIKADGFVPAGERRLVECTQCWRVYELVRPTAEAGVEVSMVMGPR